MVLCLSINIILAYENTKNILYQYMFLFFLKISVNPYFACYNGYYPEACPGSKFRSSPVINLICIYIYFFLLYVTI